MDVVADAIARAAPTPPLARLAINVRSRLNAVHLSAANAAAYERELDQSVGELYEAFEIYAAAEVAERGRGKGIGRFC